MRFVFLAIAVIASIALLTTVNAAVPPTIPGSHDDGYRPIVAEGCGYGWHWMAGHATINGGWVAGSCQINR
jgi:hypothetical protein